MDSKLFSDSVLVVGSSSKIGSYLADLLTLKCIPVWLTTKRLAKLDHRSLFLDLAQPVSTWQIPNQVFETSVICAAITSQKLCEQDYCGTYQVNVTSTVELARRLVDAGSFVIFISTNLVFDGTFPLVPADYPVNPQTAYGQQKAEAELAILALNPDSVAVVRLSKVLDPGFPLFQSWIDALKVGSPIYPFLDLYMTPVSLQFAANVLIRVIQPHSSGIIQASAINDLSYADVAYRLAEKLHLDTRLIHPVSCQTAGIVNAPRYTSLATDRLQNLGIYPPDAEQVINQLLVSIL